MDYRDSKKDEGKKDAILLSFAYENVEPPEELNPAYSLVLESRALSVPIYDGALWDWPYILRREINAAIDGETQYYNRQAKNQKRREEFEAEQAKQ